MNQENDWHKPVCDTDWLKILKTGRGSSFLERVGSTETDYAALIAELIIEKTPSQLEQENQQFIADGDQMRQAEVEAAFNEQLTLLCGDLEAYFMNKDQNLEFAGDFLNRIVATFRSIPVTKHTDAIIRCKTHLRKAETDFPDYPYYRGMGVFFDQFDFKIVTNG